MNQTTHNSIVGFIWNIADDVLRDVYVRGKYRDVILPMTVLRRLDALLEPTKEKVQDTHRFLEANKILQPTLALQAASGYPFYNTSRFTFRRLLDEPSQIRENFEDYLNGFSENVQEIIRKFKFRNQLPTLEEANILYPLIQKFLSKDINLSSKPVTTEAGVVIHEGLTNRGMGYVFEELIRRFNEENNEEAGEHFTPRDIIELMTHLIFEPIKDELQSTTYLVYDDACGSGGMLTEAEGFLQELADKHKKHVVVELYGQEVNPETFAICQADMLIKDKDPENIRFGSTLSRDQFPGMEFDFMLANPPYGKSWKVDMDALCSGKKKEITDSRYLVEHPDLPPGEKLSLLPRSSDGQLLFLVNMLSKMKRSTKIGSRIATVHNGSALFTGDAGQGESNTRRWIVENDWLECIIGLPLNMFYNTGIATYIWVLTNHKPEHRRGRVQLIDATEWYAKLRKNLGKKNCQLMPDHIGRIMETFSSFEETEQSRIFDNDDFGYRQITVDRPLRLKLQVTQQRLKNYGDLLGTRPELARELHMMFGDEPQLDFNRTREAFEARLKEREIKTKGKELQILYAVFTERDERAERVIKKCTDEAVEYEPDAELRDYENVPLKENIHEYFAREVAPHVPDAWIDETKTQIGYEISFTKYFYKFQPLRTLEEITSDIFSLEKETEGLLHEIAEV
jgi:type I restriction enzyme M protein